MQHTCVHLPAACSDTKVLLLARKQCLCIESRMLCRRSLNNPCSTYFEKTVLGEYTCTGSQSAAQVKTFQHYSHISGDSFAKERKGRDFGNKATSLAKQRRPSNPARSCPLKFACLRFIGSGSWCHRLSLSLVRSACSLMLLSPPTAHQKAI